MRGLLALLMVGGLLAFLSLYSPAQQPPGDASKGGQEKKPRVDAYGDPLPEGAVARLGARRWRHDGEIAAAIWSPNEKHIASAASDDVVYFWDASTGKTLWRTPIGSQQGSGKKQKGSGKNKLSCLAFSPDGDSIVAARGVDGGGLTIALGSTPSKPQMVLLDSTSGKIRGEFKGLSSFLFGVTFVDQGKTVLSLDDGGLVQWWDVATMKEVIRWQAVEIAKSRGGLFAPTATWSPMGDRFALRTPPDLGAKGLNPKDLRVSFSVVDVTNQKTLWQSGRDPTSMLTPPQFSSDGKLLALGGNELPAGAAAQQPAAKAGIVVCDSFTGKELFRVDALSGLLSFSGDGRVFAAADLNNTRIYDANSGKLLNTLKIANSLAGSLSVSGDRPAFGLSREGKLLLQSEGNTLAIHETDNGEPITGPEGHRGPIRWLRFGNGGQTLESWSGSGNELISWDLEKSKIAKQSQAAGLLDLGGQKFIASKQITTPDHALVLTSRVADKNIDVRERATGKVLSTLALPPKESADLRFGPVVFSPTHKHIALVESDTESWHVFETETGRYLSRVDLGGKFPRSGINLEWRIAFSQNDQFMAVADLDGKISIHELGTGKVKSRLEGMDRKWLQGNGAMAFSADGHLLTAWGDRDGPIRVWDLATNAVICQIALKDKQLPKPGFADPIKFNLPQLGSGTNDGATGLSLAFSTDNRTLAAAHRDDRQIIQVWELATAKLRHEFKGHNGPVTALAWSADGRLLASGSEDTTVLVWDVWGAEGKK